MKLCFVTENWSEVGDGANLIAILEGLKNAGHNLSVILTGDERSPDGYEYIRFYPAGMHGNVAAVTKNKHEALKNLLSSNSFDIILPFGCYPGMRILAVKSACSCPVWVCLRNDPEFMPKSPVLRFIRDFLYKKADGFVFQNKTQQEYFLDRMDVPGIVIPNFILKPSTESYANAPKERTIICISRLDERQKNLTMLFDGFIKFAKSYPEYTLKVFGEGDDREKFENYIKEKGNEWNIKLLGDTLTDDELKKAEVFVLTSRFEGSPNALISALSKGMTCICTDCGGAREMIENGKNGVLIEVDDSKTLCEALKFLAENEEIRKKLATSAFEINNSLSKSNILPLWEEAISKMR